jgi:hypothetical protein
MSCPIVKSRRRHTRPVLFDRSSPRVAHTSYCKRARTCAHVTVPQLAAQAAVSALISPIGSHGQGRTKARIRRCVPYHSTTRARAASMHNGPRSAYHSQASRNARGSSVGPACFVFCFVPCFVPCFVSCFVPRPRGWSFANPR